MARLAKAPHTSSLSSSPMRGSALPSSPPSAFQVSPMPEASQTPPLHLRARPLAKLSLNIFRLLRNHPSFHQEDENWRTRLGLYKLVQQIIESVVDAVELEPLMFSKKERRKKEDGQEVEMELGLGELKFADKVSFQSPVEDARREYFTSGKSHHPATKAKFPKPKKGKSKSTALEETNLNLLTIKNAAHLTGGLEMGLLDSEVGSEKSLFKETSIERNVLKASTTGRAKRQATTKTVLPKGNTMRDIASPGPEHEEELQKPIVPERAKRIRRGVTSRVTAVPIEKQLPMSKNTLGTRANTKANLPEEGNVTPEGGMDVKRAIPLKRSMQGLPVVTSPISSKIRVPLQANTLGEIIFETVGMIPQTRTLRSSKRLAGPKGGVEEKIKGPLRCINKELQISSEAVTGATSEEMNFNFRRLSGDIRMESCMDCTSANVTADVARQFSVVIEKIPVRNGNNANSKGMGNSYDSRPDIPGLAPTTLRRSSRSTKGVQIQELALSKGRKQKAA
ncbi:hypothetical protein L211DRAFT_865555 [Terfezia boudieri ATCC MYA-4762]|uniref:Uncharacterized protein n=1 Tax=Terfezia boudieri ATCC MYA-4762 TaxID=1051890 RepID=A0A3N4M315_9PEZI|nr:hypothetical protein L211DRAFT_865555 [Terfezia boudieri ATCC MYA-4762]